MRSILFASALLVGQAVSAATITTYTFDAELTSYNAYQHGSAGTTDVPTAYSGINAGYITFGRDGAGFGADGGCYVGIEDILTWGGSTPFYDSELSQHVGHGASYCDTFVRTFTPYWTFADGDITGDLFFTTTDFVIFEDFRFTITNISVAHMTDADGYFDDLSRLYSDVPTVPLTGTALLLVSGLGGLGALRRRKG